MPWGRHLCELVFCTVGIKELILIKLFILFKLILRTRPDYKIYQGTEVGPDHT
jgi:hypothetical protein